MYVTSLLFWGHKPTLFTHTRMNINIKATKNSRETKTYIFDKAEQKERC